MDKKISDKVINVLKWGAAITLGIAVTLGSMTITENISRNAAVTQEMNQAKNYLKETLASNLIQNNLASIDVNTKKLIVNNNTVEDYKKLDVKKDLDVYIYREILPTQEFNKLINSMTYDNGTKNYSSFYEYLQINDYYSSKDFSAEELFKILNEKKIKENYQQNYIELEDGILTFDEIQENTQLGRGAK